MRLFNFKNSLLKEEVGMITAPYSIIGYYDGLELKQINEDKEEKYLDVLSNPYQVECGDECGDECENCENCESFNLVGMRYWDNGDTTRETQFWEEDKLPFVFISCLRFSHATRKIDEVIQELEKSDNTLCYLSLDSSDLIICLRSDSYKKAYKVIEEYPNNIGFEKDENKMQKCFTYLAISQNILDQLGKQSVNIKNEEIACSLHGVIKDWDQVEAFMRALKIDSGVDTWHQFGVLGSDDIVIFTQKIKIIDLLKLYASTGLLVHGTKPYSDAFLNIRTELMVDRDGGEDE